MPTLEQRKGVFRTIFDIAIDVNKGGMPVHNYYKK